MAAREYIGEKTEQPTPRRLEEALKKGQIPRSAEVQTVFVLTAVLLALMFTGHETWRYLSVTVTGILAHLHELPLSFSMLQGYFINSTLVLLKCAGPIVVAAMLGGLLAGGIQSRFQTSSEALSFKWYRLNPQEGLKRLFSLRSAATAAIALLKLSVILTLTYQQVRSILADPLFTSSVSIGRVGAFLAQTAMGIIARVVMVMIMIAAIDYAYQFWRTSRDLMMTREEVKEENKHTEGNPLVRSRMRRRAQHLSQRKLFEEVRKADVVVVNPVRLGRRPALSPSHPEGHAGGRQRIAVEGPANPGHRPPSPGVHHGT